MKVKKITGMMAAAALSVSMLLGGCGSELKADANMIDINDGEANISLGLVNFVSRYNQASYDQVYLGLYGSSYWTIDMSGEGKSMQDDIKDMAITSIEEDYLLSKHAADYGVALTDEEKAKIEKSVDEFLEDNDEDTLEAMTATRDVVSEYLTYEAVARKMYEALKAEAKVNVTDEEAKVSSISYVYFSTAATTDEAGNTVDMSEEDKQALFDKAKQISEAGNFDLAEEFVVNVQNTVFGENKTANIDSVVTDAAKKLSEGQMSDVIEVADKGYYVVRMDKLYDKEASDTNKNDLEQKQQDEHYQEVLDGWMADTKFTVDEDLYKMIQFKELFNNMITSDDSKDTSEE